jgi:Arsenite efflux pump ACR3 and related permeases
VALSIVTGIAFGHLAPGLFQAIAAEVAQVNLPVAVLIWWIMMTMPLKFDLGALGGIKEHWCGVGVTLVINWARTQCAKLTCETVPNLGRMVKGAGKAVNRAAIKWRVMRG